MRVSSRGEPGSKGTVAATEEVVAQFPTVAAVEQGVRFAARSTYASTIAASAVCKSSLLFSS
jgi:hypothetical protein